MGGGSGNNNGGGGGAVNIANPAPLGLLCFGMTTLTRKYYYYQYVCFAYLLGRFF